jgi:gluconate 2-dehydrogenase gamma chain
MGEPLTYLNDFEARTVEAVAERVIPAAGSSPGAAQAGVVYYVDRAISGFSTGLQGLYRRGLRELAALTRRNFSAEFAELSAGQQDQVVSFLLGPPVAGVQDGDQAPAIDPGQADVELLRRLFTVIREHTVEGFFCDPAYGGNRDAAGWRLVGFPGAQWGYTAEQMRPGFDATTITIKTLADLRSELASPPPGEQFSLNDQE